MSSRKGLGDRRNRHDPAYLEAKARGYAGRAIFKLEEIDKRFRLIKSGSRVLDLGCWPGSWLQYTLERAGEDAPLVGVDLKEVELALPANVTTLVGDVFKLKPQGFVTRFGTFDVVLSDMAPNTTGNKDADLHGSEELMLRALTIAEGVLRTGGHFAAKVFQGPRFPELIERVRRSFQYQHACRPPSTRKSSREQYLIGQGLRASVFKARQP